MRGAGYDDETLRRLVAAGDAAAFGEVYDRYATAVYRACWRRCGPDEAADLLSVVFLEAWRCHDRVFVVEGSLRPWLLGITLNVCRGHRRHLRRHAEALTRFQASADVLTPDPTEELLARLDAGSAAAEALEALRRLPARQRDVADLCLVHGMTTRQAAACLGIDEGTVKSRLDRARRALRAVLRRLGELPDPDVGSGHHLHGRPPGIRSALTGGDS